MDDVVLPPDYVPKDSEPFMGLRQREYFRRRLGDWKSEIMRDTQETLTHLQESEGHAPDIADRASTESVRAGALAYPLLWQWHGPTVGQPGNLPAHLAPASPVRFSSRIPLTGGTNDRTGRGLLLRKSDSVAASILGIFPQEQDAELACDPRSRLHARSAPGLPGK